MLASVTKDIKNVLNTAHSAIKKKNYFALEGLSNRLNHSITVYQSKEISICAVAIYALSKIFDKQAYLTHPDFNIFRNNTLINLKFAATALQKQHTSEYIQALNALQTQIEEFGSKLKIYHEPVLVYARARKAKHAIEHGLSIGSAATLFDVPEWDISKQLGISEAPEKHYAPPRLNKARMELVKRIFKVK